MSFLDVLNPLNLLRKGTDMIGLTESEAEAEEQRRRLEQERVMRELGLAAATGTAEYRPQLAGMYTEAGQNALGAYDPVREMLKQMYGVETPGPQELLTDPYKGPNAPDPYAGMEEVIRKQREQLQGGGGVR